MTSGAVATFSAPSGSTRYKGQGLLNWLSSLALAFFFFFFFFFFSFFPLFIFFLLCVCLLSLLCYLSFDLSKAVFMLFDVLHGQVNAVVHADETLVAGGRSEAAFDCAGSCGIVPDSWRSVDGDPGWDSLGFSRILEDSFEWRYQLRPARVVVVVRCQVATRGVHLPLTPRLCLLRHLCQPTTSMTPLYVVTRLVIISFFFFFLLLNIHQYLFVCRSRCPTLIHIGFSGMSISKKKKRKKRKKNSGDK